MTKYAAIAAELRSSIESGVYSPGERLPTMRELSTQYDASMITIKRALDDLEHYGLIARRRGSGTYVKEGESHAKMFDKLSPFPADCARHGYQVFSAIHSLCVIHPNSDEAHALQVDMEEFVYELIRTRTDHGVTLVVERTLIPLSLCPTLRGSDVGCSLHLFLRDRSELQVESVHQIVMATHPGKQEAHWLGVGEQEALLSIRQVAFLDNGIPCALSFVTHAPQYEFRNLSTKSLGG